MKVWLVGFYTHEWHDITKIFDSEEKAREWLNTTPDDGFYHPFIEERDVD